MAEFVEFILRRTYRNGARQEPLSMKEINTLKDSLPLQINVKLIHSEEGKEISCDPATIAEEVCLELANQLNIKSTFGWSLFAELDSEVNFRHIFLC